MNIDIYKKGSYLVFRIRDDIGLSTDLIELRKMIERELAGGARYVALAFSPDSYLYTRSIAVLIACSEMIKDTGGHLAIVDANKDILDILSVIDFDKMIRIFSTEEELALASTAP